MRTSAFNCPLPYFKTLSRVQASIQKKWEKLEILYTRHGMAVGIIILTTCQLAAKIFKSIPEIVPRLATGAKSWIGIIFLNNQIEEFIKSLRDLKFAIKEDDVNGMIQTAAKVVLKLSGILFTLTAFIAAIVALLGFPAATISINLTVRPAALSSLSIKIVVDAHDYISSHALLINLKDAGRSETAQKVAQCFKSIIIEGKVDKDQFSTYERALAYRTLRQLDIYSLKDVKDKINGKNLSFHEIYQEMIRVIGNTQRSAEANILMTGFGYISMGICKAYSETAIDYSLRLATSIYYLADGIFKRKMSKGEE